MASFYHQIFYENNKFDTPFDISLLKPFMYSYELKEELIHKVKNINETKKNNFEENLQEDERQLEQNNVQENERKNEQDIKIKTENKMKNKKYFIKPKNYEDNLFWCSYIAVYGYEKYQSRNANIEMEEKQKIIEYVKRNTSEIKNINHKLTKICIQELLSDLMTNKKLEINHLCLLNVFYKKNIIIYVENEDTTLQEDNKGLYFEIYNETTKTKNDYILIKKNSKNEYSLFLYSNETETEIKNIKENMFLVNDFQNPLKAISSYKISELYEISLKVGMKLKEKTKKNELYIEIKNYCKCLAEFINYYSVLPADFTSDKTDS